MADDHAVVRDGLRSLLEAEGDISVVGEAADGHETVRRVQELNPDVVIMDIAMPKLNGIEATQQIHETCPSTRVIILSMHATAEHIFRALQAGAQGYLVKESAGREVVMGVRAVHSGSRHLSQHISDKVIEDYLHRRQAAPTKSPLERLSSRSPVASPFSKTPHTRSQTLPTDKELNLCYTEVDSDTAIDK